MAEISAANDEAAAALKAVERRLSDMAVLIKNISTYRQTRPVALEYRKAKDKAAYRREHESQLILYEAAAKAIKDAGVTKLPNLAALKAEYTAYSCSRHSTARCAPLPADHRRGRRQIQIGAEAPCRGMWVASCLFPPSIVLQSLPQIVQSLCTVALDGAAGHPHKAADLAVRHSRDTVQN